MTVTEPIPAARPPGAALLPNLQRLLPEAAGRAALLLPAAGPLTAAPHRRRAARLLLQDTAQAGGGQVFETAAGELLLFGAPCGAAAEVAATLARLAPGEPAPEPLALPEATAALLAWAEAASLAPPAQPSGGAAPPPTLAALDAQLAALAPERVLRRRTILLHASRAVPVPAARRLLFSRTTLAAELGPLAADPDLLRHAEERLAARLPPLAATEAQSLPLLLPLPLHAPPPPAPRPGLIGVLPLAAAAGPGGLAARRAALAEAGWNLAIEGLEAATLHLLPATALAADLLLLRWSPALEGRAVQAALRSLPPLRLVLTGCTGPEALDWGLATGLAHFAGPAIEPLPAAGGGTSRPCATRGTAGAGGGPGRPVPA